MGLTNHEALGNLIKSWSTKDPQYTGGTLYPEPATPDELRQLLLILNGGHTIPDHITKLTIIHYGLDEMVLRIPPGALIKATEEKLGSQPYSIPAFYLDDPIKGTEDSASRDDKLLLQARRIGDYSIAHCE
jgi:hypothetical protein